MNDMIVDENIACFIQGNDRYQRGKMSKIDLIRRCVIPPHLVINPMYLETYRSFANEVTQKDLLDMIKVCDLHHFDHVLGTAIAYSNPIFDIVDGDSHIKHLLDFFKRFSNCGKTLNLCYNVLDLGWGKESSAYKVAYCLRNHHVFEGVEFDKAKY